MQPNLVQKGDTIAIISPAKAIDKKVVEEAKKIIEQQGFKVLIGENCFKKQHYFAGTRQERLSDLQWAIDDKNIKAILCARGGYGSIQLLDKIDWSKFICHPKWLIGFSDITVFHQQLAALSISSIHGTMPLHFSTHSKEALSTLFRAIKKGGMNYEWTTKHNNIPGKIEGEIVGGNLAVLCGLIGTKEVPNYQDKILFLEEVGEPLYAIDRYFYHLKKAGIIDQISGLIVGAITNCKDSKPPFGSTIQEIILSHFQDVSIPVSFDFPAGHIDNNCALIFGKQINLEVGRKKSKLWGESI